MNKILQAIFAKFPEWKNDYTHLDHLAKIEPNKDYSFLGAYLYDGDLNQLKNWDREEQELKDILTFFQMGIPRPVLIQFFKENYSNKNQLLKKFINDQFRNYNIV